MVDVAIIKEIPTLEERCIVAAIGLLATRFKACREIAKIGQHGNPSRQTKECGRDDRAAQVLSQRTERG